MKWEYTTLPVDDNDFYSDRMRVKLNMAGAAGWEMVATIHMRGDCLAIFKQPLFEPQPLKESVRYVQRHNGDHDPLSEKDQARILVSFPDRATAVGWIEDRAHPDRYELIDAVFQASSGMERYESHTFHVLRRTQ